jgi:hypothetical protein
MGSSPTPPQPQDAGNVAAQQQQYNTQSGQQSQEGSMVNQSTPYGSLTYNQTGTASDGTPLYTATTSLSPQQQQLLNLLQGNQTTAGTQAGQLLNNANYGSSNPSDVIGNATSGLTQQAMGQEVSYLNPFFTQQTSQLDAQLRNQGLDPSSPAYKQAMNNLSQSQNQTVTGFEASMEPQMYQQAENNYLLPLTMSSTLMGESSPTNPQFQSTPSLNIQPANYEGAVSTEEQQQQQTYQDQLNQNNAMMSGLFGIGSSVLGGWAKSGGLSSLMAAAPLAL